MDPGLRKQLGVKKSLQALEQVSSPSYRSASPLLKEAGTPAPFLPSMKKDLFASTITEKPSLFDSFNSKANESRGSESSFYHQQSFLNDSNATRNDTMNFSLRADPQDPQIENCMGMFGQFMDLYSNHPHSGDIFELIDQYEQTCRKNIKQLLEFINKTDPSRKRMKKAINLLNQLYQECYTWRLLGSLVHDRLMTESMEEMDEDLDEPTYIDTTRSERLIVDKLFKQDASIRHSQIIVDWLEKNMQDKVEDQLQTDNLKFHTESVYWEHTLHELNSFAMGNRDPALSSNLVTEIDPDAPVRQKRNLSSLDQHDEEQLLQCVFRFIRAGKLEEAQKVCCDQGHYWRAASLDGWRLWHDPNYFMDSSDELQGAEGNPNRSSWKLNCWALSEEKFCNIHEKAIYATLSGNLHQILPACGTWDDCLWAYFKVMVDLRVEQELKKQSALGNSSNPELPTSYWQQSELHDLSLSGIFEQLRAHSKSDIRGQGQEPYRMFQSNIILNEIEELLNNMYQLVTEDKENSHLLRCMAHMVLFLQAIGLQTQEEICVAVLKKFVENLIENQQHDLVAAYTACLPSELQVEIYAKFLQGINDAEIKRNALDTADQFGLELKLITKRIVENIRTENFQDSANTEDEKRIIGAIDWLVFNPSQRIEAIKQANAIIRNFLGLKNHDAARSVFSKIPTDSIDIVYKQWRMRAGEKALPPADDNAVHEYLSIKAYLSAHDAFNAWFDHYHNKAPVKPKDSGVGKRTFKEKIAYDEAVKEYTVECERWQKSLEIHINATSEAVYNVFLFPGGWLVDQRKETNTDGDRQEQISLLRQLCIPYLTLLLHKVLSSNKQHRQCFQLAEIIQSSKYRLYELFQKEELRRFLHLIRESAISLLDAGSEPFGYESLHVYKMDRS
ncbi:nuclear pore complex protein Nup107-like isoform X1 [Clytia hemisphaerica]|uniref:Nuclear pore complex protein n=1 Tax=Clytia hemisphaerica TaxID=252671 RepID=A0A7M5US36_9CNID